MTVDSPAFGKADLSNCERELIHLAGSVQPQGALLLVHLPELLIIQASANTDVVLGEPVDALLNQGLARLGGSLRHDVMRLLPELGVEPQAMQTSVGSGPARRQLEGALHRAPGGGLVIELEAVDPPPSTGPRGLILDAEPLKRLLAAAVQRFSSAASIGALTDAIVQVLRDLTGYDRVMVYRFDTAGHGKIVSEARDMRLESLLGHHYPASDIPQRARELYLRNRVRVLVDVDYEPQLLVPPLRPDSGQPLDMSLCQLRSMSPLHLQYLRNMGVTGTLVASLVRDGKLWGLIAAHHYSPRRLRLSLRSAVDLLAEVASTRIAAIENYAHAQVALMVRRLEQRLIEATAAEGDWRLALFRNPHTLLQPVEATGSALFHGGEILTTGEVPSTPELRALCRWVDTQAFESPFECSAVGKAEPTLEALTATACGVLAVKLSTSRSDYLMWFRKEQLLTVTWAGNPAKPFEGNDPLQLSPRRSFEAWSEIVRGTALPWTHAERAMARAIGVALVDIIVQVHAVRLLIAEHQLQEIRATVGTSREAVLVADPQGALLFANEAFGTLRGAGQAAPQLGTAVAGLFVEAAEASRHFGDAGQQSWHGDWTLIAGSGPGLPVAVRVEAVPSRVGALLGYIVAVTDLSDVRRTAQARRQLEAALMDASGGPGSADEVINAILTNASLAAMDVADGNGPSVAGLLEELETSAQRAAALYGQIRGFS
jgi:light-regulated signal transduction histidine kinase (bacteriophytochrome)